MWQFALPALKAIGINAGVNLLRRKPIFENAATAGVTGGILGGFNGGAFGGGEAGGAVNAAGAEVAKKAIASNVAAGVPGFTSAAIPETIQSAGMVFNPSTGTYLNPEYYAGATTPLATYTGGEGLLSNATSGLLSSLPDYVTPQNLIGAANLISQQSPQPSFASSGGIRAGSFSPKNASSTGIAVRKKEQGYA